jgi:hypothetical protein
LIRSIVAFVETLTSLNLLSIFSKMTTLNSTQPSMANASPFSKPSQSALSQRRASAMKKKDSTAIDGKPSSNGLQGKRISFLTSKGSLLVQAGAPGSGVEEDYTQEKLLEDDRSATSPKHPMQPSKRELNSEDESKLVSLLQSSSLGQHSEEASQNRRHEFPALTQLRQLDQQGVAIVPPPQNKSSKTNSLQQLTD